MGSTPQRSWMIPVVLFLAVHTGTLIWVLASTNTTLQYLADQVRELKVEIGAVRGADSKLGVLSSQVQELTRRVDELEARP